MEASLRHILLRTCHYCPISNIHPDKPIAIKLESKGPVLFKSKRVGTNYTIFDFLKFRSMYTDAEERLKDLSKNNNQYTEKEEEDDHKTITAPLGEEAEQDMLDMGMESEMMISDEEIMLIGDDFVVAESDFNKQKEEEINNAFVKIENDPRITKVGRFIRKYSIDEPSTALQHPQRRHVSCWQPSSPTLRGREVNCRHQY